MRIAVNQHALVLGAGASGAACALFLHSRGWRVTVADTRQNPPDAPRLAAAGADMELALGRMDADLVDSTVTLVVVSPGLSPEHSLAAAVCSEARARGIAVVGEIELFARELKRLAAFRGYRPRVIGITGTNGKTTTTTITGLMCRAAGASVCVAGNIGPNALTELTRHLEANTLPDVWVLELSSFQLETTESLECTAAALLNLTEDHVDWHGSMERYGAAKARIFAQKTVRVLNRDDAFSATLVRHGSTDRTFGDSVPEGAGAWGIDSDGRMEWLSFVPVRPKLETKAAQLAAEPEEVLRLMPVEALKIAGRHNAMNALAALALIDAAGLSVARALTVLATYRGEAHRVEKINTVDGVDYVDDSKGTNVGAVVAALEGFAKAGRTVHLIAGGDGKGQNFAPLAPSVARACRTVALIGRDRALIAEALASTGVKIEDCGTDFVRAVTVCREAARAGDVVLLSPACASWDMFKSYAERSRLFIETVAGFEHAADKGGAA